MKYVRAVFFICSAIFSPTLLTNEKDRTEVSLFANFESLAWSESFPLADLDGKTKSDYESGESIFVNGSTEIGVRSRSWELALIARADHFVDHSGDLSALTYLQENNLPIKAGTDYRIYSDIEVAHSRGLRLGYVKEVFPAMRLGFRVSYLQASRIISARALGHFRLLENGTPFGTANFVYHAGTDYLFDEKYAQPEGQGYAADLFFGWQVNKNWVLSIDAKDIYNEIRWPSTPRTVAAVDSMGLRTDDSDRLISNPLLSGRQNTVGYDQVLPRRTMVEASYRFANDSSIAVESFISNGAIIPTLKYSDDSPRKNRWSMEFSPTVNAYGIGVHYNDLSFSVRVDGLNDSEIRYILLDLTLSLRVF